MLNLLKMQKQVVTSCTQQGEITICATGAGSGQSVSSYVLPILLGDKVTVLTRTHVQAVRYFEQCLAFYRSHGIPHQVDYKRLSASIINTSGKIQFKNQDNGRGASGIVVVESPQQFDKGFINNLIENSTLNQHTLFLTRPYECGWRNHKFENGIVCFDERGVTSDEVSWDYDLINWDLDSTRAEIEWYKDGVNVITGFGLDSNIYLDPSYSRAFRGLNPLDKFRLSGEWV